MKEARVKKKKLYHLPMWVGVFMGIALWSILADAGSRARGFYESKVAEVPVSDKTPTVLKIEGDDDDIHVYPSDRFEIKYRFFLHGAHRVSPEKAAEIFSKFEVHYKNGVLTSKFPPRSLEYTGAGVLYEIGLPSQLGLEVNFDDGDIVVDRVVLSALKISGADGDVSLNNTQVFGVLNVYLEDGDVTLKNTTLNGTITLQDGDVRISASRGNIGKIETEVRKNGDVEYHAPGCAVNGGLLSCTKGKGELKISVADGDVVLKGN